MIDRPGNCSSTPLAVDVPCFCRPLSFGHACRNNCGLSWERKEYLEWLNATCSSTSNWHGLPSNWTKLLYVQDSELPPWHWRVQSDDATLTTYSNSTTTKVPSWRCPS